MTDQEATPETLRDWLAKWAPKGTWMYDEGLAHADAWEIMEERLLEVEREHAWMKALILRMERHHVLRYVEGPSYATGDFDELAFVRRLVDKEPKT
jgi:hypothetical protein